MSPDARRREAKEQRFPVVGLPLPHDYDALTVLGCVVEERGCLTYGLAPRARGATG